MFILPIIFCEIIHWFERSENCDFIYLNVFYTKAFEMLAIPTVADFSVISTRIIFVRKLMGYSLSKEGDY